MNEHRGVNPKVPPIVVFGSPMYCLVTGFIGAHLLPSEILYSRTAGFPPPQYSDSSTNTVTVLFSLHLHADEMKPVVLLAKL